MNNCKYCNDTGEWVSPGGFGNKYRCLECKVVVAEEYWYYIACSNRDTHHKIIRCVGCAKDESSAREKFFWVERDGVTQVPQGYTLVLGKAVGDYRTRELIRNLLDSKGLTDVRNIPACKKCLVFPEMHQNRLCDFCNDPLFTFI